MGSIEFACHPASSLREIRRWRARGRTIAYGALGSRVRSVAAARRRPRLTEIADGPRPSRKTVGTRKARILDRLNMASTAELVRCAVEHRLLDDQS